MAHTIFKYSLDAYGDAIQLIDLPVGATVLSAAIQPARIDFCTKEVLRVWALVNREEKKTEKHKFCVSITGGLDVPPYRKFLGTHLLEEGTYVTHVFHIGVGPVPV